MKEHFHRDTNLYLQSLYEIQSETRGEKEWFAFELTPMACDQRGKPLDHEDAGVFKFHSAETARNFVEGWISRERKELVGVASNEAAEAEKFQRKAG